VLRLVRAFPVGVKLINKFRQLQAMLSSLRYGTTQRRADRIVIKGKISRGVGVVAHHVVVHVME